MFKTFFTLFLLVLVTQLFCVHSRNLRSATTEGVTIASARKYLKAFGYLQDNNKTNLNNTRDMIMKVDDNDSFDEDLESSIKNFQQYYQLKISGKLDSETTKLMSSPRCGVPDNIKVTSSSRFAFINGKPQWPTSKRHLTYAFHSSVEVLPLEILRRVFKEAFKQWTCASPFTFSEARNRTSGSDLTIGFFKGDHGDGSPFEKSGLVLAHAFEPTDGRLHINADELWSDEVPIEKGYYDLVWVAMHEIGHVLGLDHSSHRHAIMYAYVRDGVNRRKLSADDVASIRGLYNSSMVAGRLSCSAVLIWFCLHLFYLIVL